MTTRPFGLRARFVITFALVAALSSIAVAGTSFLLVRHASVNRAIDTRSRETLLLIEEAATQLRASLGPADIRRNLAAQPSPFTFEVAVEHPGGFETASPALAASTLPSSLRTSAGNGRTTATSVRTRGELGVVVASPLPAADDLVAYFLFPLGGVVDDLALLRVVLTWAGVGVVLASGGVGWIAASGVLKPIQRAHRAARRLEAGSLDTRLPDAGKDEFAELAQAFNSMAQELQRTVGDLQELERSHRRFVSDVSHELRTPLTALLASGDVLEANATGLNETGARAAGLLVVETRRLARLVEDLMEISRMDAGTALMAEEQLDMGSRVRLALDSRGWTGRVSLRTCGEGSVVADPRRLDAIIVNLVGNALEHGRPPVDLVVEGGDDEVRFVVSDAGVGIPADEIDRVFNRFYKVDPARGRGGSGLGLAIARENARLHKGDITARARDGGGLTFTLNLPRT